jgi:predicted acylesterase/phospholipase RssA
MTASISSPPAAPGAAPSAAAPDSPANGLIGRPQKPIRVISFAGGLFDTALQLGVVHALLVSRGRAPDIVIGSSAGAVNAVALAEVLQAGPPDAQVARFRQLLEAYRQAPGEIAQAFRPDQSRVDTQRPLEPLKLPVHHWLERRGRLAAVAAQAGLINLYNTLLNIRLTIGTITQGVRRWLGVQAAAEIRKRWARPFVVASESFRSWTLLGVNLRHAAALVPPIIEASLRSGPSKEEGATAGELIFASKTWRVTKRNAAYVASLLVLIAVWLMVSTAVAVVPTVVGDLLLRAGRPVWGVLAPRWHVLIAFWLGWGAVCLLFISLTSGRSLRALVTALGTVLVFGLLIGIWSLALAAALSVPLLLDAAYNAIARGTMFRWPWQYGLTYWIALPVVLLAIGVLGVGLLGWRGKTIGIRLLALYCLDDAILDPDALRQLLTRLMDPGYYGEGDINRVVEQALRDDNTPQRSPLGAKLVGSYAQAEKVPPIHVAVTVADVASGKLRTLPGSVRVVDALVAALARPPLFPPVSCDGHLLVDATAVAQEPTQALMALLRDPGLVDERAAAVNIYCVAPFPFNQGGLGPTPGSDGRPQRYGELLDVVKRAKQLRRFRDATVERRLTELHTCAMPRAGSVFFPTSRGPLVRAWVYSIEPEHPLDVNLMTMQAESEAKRRQIIAETVADGCRAALQMMIQPAMDATATENTASAHTARGVVMPCRAAIEKHLTPRGITDSLPGSAPPPPKTPSKGAVPPPSTGPGVFEVCEHCALYRRPLAEEPVPRPQTLIIPEKRTNAPEWPVKGADPDWVEPPHAMSPRVPELGEQLGSDWPAPRPGIAGDQRSTVSLLFSGGVFRGVFQVGVLNAVSEASLRPDVVAGASVGSITAAMVARAFVTDSTLSGPDALQTRQIFIQRLAATYLAIDRLVLTDRFADFVRGLTVRAAQARFSLREADRVLRRFDAADPWTFNRELRRVVAGIERLTYVSPFELRDLVESARRQRGGRAMRLLGLYFQELLDRAGVGLEVLGAEPLELLIRDYVLEGLTNGSAEHVTFETFLDRGLLFLATATNLTDGRLETLGEEQLGGMSPNLLQALLASSAFPGVFRPRWSWELRPGTAKVDQYIDGGVIDNLPLDAVASFLEIAARAELIPHRPDIPHVILSASLEPQPLQIGDAPTLEELRHNWPRLRRRAAELAYNRKLELFSETQKNLRAIVEARGNVIPAPDWIPLDLEVVTVIPRWLCGTFAFHPMLGFRRRKQARSIAHGCASTLLELGRLITGKNGPARVAAWGIAADHVPSAEQALAADPFVPIARRSKKGNCWYRPAVPCPFSFEGQRQVGGRDGTKASELNKIYNECRDIATHRPQ